MQDAHASKSSRPRSPRLLARLVWLVIVLAAGMALGAGLASRYARTPQSMVVLAADQAAALRLASGRHQAEAEQ